MPAKPKLGQNFLHDTQAIERIASALGNCSTRTVVEIGPGQGAITRLLSVRALRVIAVELDRELAGALRTTLPDERVSVVLQDVLSFDFDAAAASAGERLLVVGNLPYYITSPILLKLAANHRALDRAVLMVQREVADRVTAHPGSRDYGLLSITAQMYGPAERLFTLPPAAFSPPPEVHSTVIRWSFHPRFEEFGVEEKSFLGFARQAFAQKRKTLANNLRAAGFAPADTANALASAGVDAQVRAEKLDLAQFSLLWRSLHAKEAASLQEAASMPD